MACESKTLVKYKKSIENILKDTILITKDELKCIISSVVAEVVAGINTQPSLPVYYKFPEDIYTTLKGFVAKSTIRNWRSYGYLKVTKIGQKAFVKPKDWEWVVENYGPLMRKDYNKRFKS